MQPKRNSSSSPVKLRTKKTNAFKDIEEWVLTGTNFKESSRMSGTLTENVTEERMYKAKLFDLGKERYNFISHCAYEKQRFIDTMKKKPGAFKQIMSEISRASSPGLQASKNRVNERKMKISLMNKNFKNEKEDNKTQEEDKNVHLKRSKTVHFPPNKSLQTFVPDGYGEEPLRSSTPSHTGFRPAQTAFSTFQDSRPPNPQHHQKPNTTFKFSRNTESRSPVAWGKEKRVSKYGGKPPGVTDDRRYKMLETALSLNYTGKEDIDLKDIIERNETLNTTPRNYKEAKPNMELKLIEFMKERGLEFPLRPFSQQW